jgi:hypothetical protein
MRRLARVGPRSAWPSSGRRRLAQLLLGAGLAGGACQLDELLRAPEPPGSSNEGPGPAVAVRLAFTVQPGTTITGAAIAPAVRVAALDQDGNTVTSFTGSITVTLSNGSGAGTLTGGTSGSATQGVADFPGLAVDQPGAGYRLVAAAAALAPAISEPFDVTRRVPALLAAVSGDGQSDTVRAALRDPYVVRVTDAEGVPLGGIEIRWTAGAGDSVTPPMSFTDEAGEARTVHTLGTTAGAYGVIASIDVLPGQAVTFTSVAGPGTAARLVFTQEPTDAGRGESIAPPVQVTVLDQYGNTATGFTSTVTITITPGTGTPGARLDGDRTRNPVAGVATFNSLRIRDFGLGYRLQATVAGLLADSAPFNVLLLEDLNDDAAGVGR